MKKIFTYNIALALCGILLLTIAAKANPDCHEVRGTVVAHLVPPAAACPAGTISGVAGDVFDASNNQIGTTTACLTSLEQNGKDGALRATLTRPAAAFATSGTATTCTPLGNSVSVRVTSPPW